MNSILLFLARLTLPWNYHVSKWFITQWAKRSGPMAYLILLNLEFDENNLWFRGKTSAEHEAEHQAEIDEVAASLGGKVIR